MTMRLFAGVCLFTCAALALVSSATCGGSGYSSSPATPSPVTPGGGAASAAISIVGTNGANSFTPNPANISTGTTFAWKNNDAVTHRIVFDDGSVDSGNLTPGATSAAMTLASNGARYHCTIHPTMVGSINTTAGNPPPCTGQDRDSVK